MSYASLANLREYLPQVATGAAKDAELTAVLDRAHEIAVTLVGFRFAAYGTTATAQDVRAPGNVGHWLEVPYHDATSGVTAVKEICGRGLSYESADTITGYIREADGRLYHDDGWTPGAWYRVTAKWGYGPAPADAVQLDLQIAVNIWRARDAANFSGVVGVEGQGAVAYNRAVTWSERNLADGIRARYLGVVHA